MVSICVTGEAGSGKSYVCSLLNREFDFPVIDSDGVARKLMMPGNKVFKNVTEFFGDEYLDRDGFIDRKKLATLVFENKDMLTKLNSLTHPAVIDEIKSLISEYEIKGIEAVIIESAIALDCGYEKFCDEFWYVHANEASRRMRLLQRGYSDEKIDSIIASQSNGNFFREHCTAVIENSNELSDDELIIQINKILKNRNFIRRI